MTPDPSTLFFLKNAGISIPSKIRITNETRLVHDLREDLDNIWYMFRFLRDKHGIEVPDHEISKFLPKGILDWYIYDLQFIPIVKRRIEKKYPPLTVGMIQTALKTGVFPMPTTSPR